MRVLAIDSSGIVASVAVVEETKVLAEYTVNNKKTHSQTLLPMIDELKKMVISDLKELDAIVVAKGPGSFTGLRIGVSTAKALGLALDIPIIGVPTVEAMAYQLFDFDGLVCPMMDARRGQVYTGLYKVSAGRIEAVIEQTAMDTLEMVQLINTKKEKVVFLGDGVPVYEDLIKDNINCEYLLAPAFASRQRASALGVLGIEYAKEGRTESADDFKPEYLRASQAERERAVFLNKVQLVPMTEEYIKEVADLEERTFTKPWSEESLKESLNSEMYKFYTAVMDNKVVGYCGYYKTGDEANITNVIVAENFRGKGIGHALMTHLMNDAFDEGINAVTLEVRVSNMSARNLYESLGFSLDGIRKNFYSSPVEDACIYWLRK